LMRLLTTLWLVFFIVSGEGNEIVGSPFVSCAEDAIYAKWRTNVTFNGEVTVRFAKQPCYRTLVTNNQIELLVPHLACQIARKRSLDPPGVLLSASVLIAFHEEFMTGSDRIYQLECLHTRGPLMQSTAFLSSTNSPILQHPPPSCSYKVQTEIEGEEASVVRLGDSLHHDWSCMTDSTQGDLCLVVRNCLLVTDDSEYQIIGNDGCSMDEQLLPQPIYYSPLHVGQIVPMFGVNGKPVVHFQCELTLEHMENPDACPVTDCTQTKIAQRRRRHEPLSDQMEVRSQNLHVMGVGCFCDSINVQHERGIVCVSFIVFVLVVICTVSIAIVTLTIVLATLAIRERAGRLRTAR